MNSRPVVWLLQGDKDAPCETVSMMCRAWRHDLRGIDALVAALRLGKRM